MGLLEALKQYASDAAGGSLNPEVGNTLSGLLNYGKDRARYIGGLLDDSSPINKDLRNWHDRTQLGLADLIAGKEGPQADYGYSQIMNMAGNAPMGITKVIGPRHEAMETARKNAVKMLGLPENNTAMDRALAMGFDTPRYHGTKGDPAWKGIDAFELERANNGLYGEGVYTTSSPKIAGGGVGNTIAPQGYATNEALNTLLKKEQEAQAELKQVLSTLEEAKAAGDTGKVKIFQDWADGLQNDLKGYGEWKTGGGAVYPLMVSNPNPFNPDKMKFKRSDFPPELRTQIEDRLLSLGKNPKGKYPMSYGLFSDAMGGEVQANQTLRELGYTGIQHKGGAVTGVPIKHTVDMLFEPNQVRSRFAAFDPARRHEVDLLGRATPEMLGLTTLGSLLGLEAMRRNQE